MRARLHHDPAVALPAAAEFMAADPFSANVIGVVTQRLLAAGEPPSPGSRWAILEDDDGRICGLAMHTPPHPLFLSRMSERAAVALADALAEDGCGGLPGVNGAVESTTAFAERWARRTGRRSTILTAMRMYRLEQLTHRAGVSGSTALAREPDDVTLVASWLRAFHEEATPRHPPEDWVAFARRRVAAGQVHLWKDHGAPVSLAAVSAPVAGVARIGPVYTPRSLRRNGYGAAVTAAATAAAIAGGAEHVVLYTDLANPVSNSIYQAIGYRPEHDAEERIFQ